MDPQIKAIATEMWRAAVPMVRDYAMAEVQQKLMDREQELNKKSIEERMLVLKKVGFAPQEEAQVAKTGLAADAIPKLETILDTLDPRRRVGRPSWMAMHAAAEQYAEKPTADDRARMEGFVMGIVKNFPCSDCSEHALAYLQDHPLNFTSRAALVKSLCEFHNASRKALGKPLTHAC